MKHQTILQRRLGPKAKLKPSSPIKPTAIMNVDDNSVTIEFNVPDYAASNQSVFSPSRSIDFERCGDSLAMDKVVYFRNKRSVCFFLSSRRFILFAAVDRVFCL